jgi:hypothetical protein
MIVPKITNPIIAVAVFEECFIGDLPPDDQRRKVTVISGDEIPQEVIDRDGPFGSAVSEFCWARAKERGA